MRAVEGWSLSRPATSKPLMPGIIRSRMMTSGAFSFAAAKPVSPLKALDRVAEARQLLVEELVERDVVVDQQQAGLRLIGR